MKNGIAYCGVDCASCPDFIGRKCPSCRLTEWKEDDVCMPVKCCREKKIDCCGFCGGFPCADMREFYAESDGHRKAYRSMLALRQ